MTEETGGETNAITNTPSLDSTNPIPSSVEEPNVTTSTPPVTKHSSFEGKNCNPII